MTRTLAGGSPPGRAARPGDSSRAEETPPPDAARRFRDASAAGAVPARGPQHAGVALMRAKPGRLLLAGTCAGALPPGLVFGSANPGQLLQRAASHLFARRFHARGVGAELPLLAKLPCPRPWPGPMRFLVLVAACAGARRLDIVGDGTRKYASQGACYDPTTQITVCFRPWAYDWSSNLTQAERLSQSECEAVGNTWYAKGHIGSDGCCLCDSNCDHSLETAAAGTCNYADANAGSCKNAATGQVTCDVTAGQCASPNVWSAAGALDSDGCCFCDETCDHSAETGTDCHLKGYADESESSGSCYDMFGGHSIECDMGHAECAAKGLTSIGITQAG